MSEQLIQELNCLAEMIMQLKAKVDKFYKEFHKPLKKDNALHDLMIMKENIHSLIVSRDNIEDKVRVKDEDTAIALLLLENNGEQEEEEEFEYTFDQETPTNSFDQQCGTDIEMEFTEEIKSEPEEDEEIQDCSDPDYDPGSEEELVSLSKEVKSESEDNVHKLSRAKNKTIKIPINKTSAEQVECSICQKLVKANYLKRHENSHVQKLAKKFTCTTCQKSFGSKTLLKCHTKIHGEKKFICDQCGWRFHLSNNLKIHMRKHEEDRPYVCKECRASFKHIQSLRIHLNVVHAKNGIQCAECGLLFSSKPSLKKHVFNIHEQNAPRKHKCSLCEKSFKQTSALKYHLTTHSNPKTKHRGLNKSTGPITLAGKPRIVRNKWHTNQDNQQQAITASQNQET